MIGPDAMAANSPFSDYAAAAVGLALVVGVLVAVLIGGGLMILNFGLMTKRPEDRLGDRDPSDVGFMQSTLFPEHALEDQRVLPATEEGEDEVNTPAETEQRPDPRAA